MSRQTNLEICGGPSRQTSIPLQTNLEAGTAFPTQNSIPFQTNLDLTSTQTSIAGSRFWKNLPTVTGGMLTSTHTNLDVLASGAARFNPVGLRLEKSGGIQHGDNAGGGEMPEQFGRGQLNFHTNLDIARCCSAAEASSPHTNLDECGGRLCQCSQTPWSSGQVFPRRSVRGSPLPHKPRYGGCHLGSLSGGRLDGHHRLNCILYKKTGDAIPIPELSRTLVVLFPR